MPAAGFHPKDSIAQRFAVAFEYPVVFCRGAFEPGDPHLTWAIARGEHREHRVVFVADAGVVAEWPELGTWIERFAKAHAGELDLRVPLLTVQAGEAAKNDPNVVTTLVDQFAQARLDRQAAVIAIGGGAVLDAVGYAASVVHRGLRVVRMPTTVLAQNDAGIGVKTGVNAFGAKNFLGTFAPPYAVVNDARWLETLPQRDIRAGFAEAVKVALIRDAQFFDWIEAHTRELDAVPTSSTPNPALETLIRRCAELHLRHIATAGDPFETGSARPLDYGHWAAHRLELLSDHELRHGEAVAIGMWLDARYAVLTGQLSETALQRIGRVLGELKLPRYHPALAERSGGRLAILDGLAQFREHLGGTLSVTLLTGIGTSIEVSEMDDTLIQKAVEWLADAATA